MSEGEAGMRNMPKVEQRRKREVRGVAESARGCYQNLSNRVVAEVLT